MAGSLGAIALFVVLGLVATALQAGCATKVHRRVAKPFAPRAPHANQGQGEFLGGDQACDQACDQAWNQGAAWDTVLPGPGGAQAGYELARRDRSLSRRDRVSPAYQDAFASERLPTLDARSYLYLSRSENRFLYFSRPARQPRWIEP